jgi:hypothetical protein
MVWRIALVVAALIVCVPAQAAEAPPLTVIGTIRAPDVGIVLCRDLGGNFVSLSVGTSFAGWTLKSVTMDRAIFERASETVTLKLTGAPQRPVIAQPATAPPYAQPNGSTPSTAAIPKGRWVDGDGQIIDPPKL